MWENVSKLEKKLAQGLEGRDRVDVLNDLAWRLRGIDAERTKKFLQEAESLAESLDYKRGLARAHLTQDFMFTLRGSNSGEIPPRIEETIGVFRTHNDAAGEAMALGLKSMFLWRIGDREGGFSAIYKALDITKDTEEYEMIGWGESILSSYFLDLEDYQQALPHVQRSEHMFEKCGELIGLSACVNNRGTIHRMLGEYEMALLCHERGKEIALDLGQADIVGRSVRDMGMVYEAMGELQTAREQLEESLRVREQVGNWQGIVTTLTDLGRISATMGHFDEAEQFLFKARKKAEDLVAKPKLMNIFYEQAQLYKKAQEPALALQYYEKYMTLKSEVEGEQNVLHVKNLQAVFEAERSKQEAEIERLRNVELKALYEQIERHREGLLSSIRYARGIQDALLKPVRWIENHLPQGMVLYHPKDIVSGDFYWYAEVGGVSLVAAVDCTGHGVPGAFMVVLSHGLLNEIVEHEGITEPAEVLTELDDRLTHILQQREADHASYDGLDIALVQRDPEAGRLKFAGAKRPLLCLRDGEVFRVKGSRASIGGWVGEERVEKDFAQVEWIVKSGDRFFLHSDGYADQFGGPRDRKYGARRFRELLKTLPPDAPAVKQALTYEHERWRGDTEQTDDLVVISWQEP